MVILILKNLGESEGIGTDELVEFKGQFYSIPASKIGHRPLQKPHPPMLLGGFSPKTFLRIINYADGWIPVAGFGPLEQLEQAVSGLREGARKANKDPSKIRIFVLTYPNVLHSSTSSSSPSPTSSFPEQQRFL
jgi:alkanesulfonate monooxygenase SsuD/methylene tetrahydromethanopterin reductase-like flavin-dependent oxidoreductase (luciferase family)